MEGKKKNIFIRILGVTTVAVAGVALYFGLKYNSSRIENAKLQEIVNEPKQTEVVEKEKIVTEYAIPEINYENCINPGQTRYQRLLDKYGIDVVHKACVKLDNFIKTEGYIPFRTPAMALGRRFCNIAKAELDSINREEKLEP